MARLKHKATPPPPAPGSPLSGFTLIEVLIALTLLSFIGFWTSQSISQAVRSKKKIQNMVDRSSLLLDAMQVIQMDINKAFHYYDINVDLYNESQEERIKNCQKNARGGPNTWPTPQYCNNLKSKFKLKKQKNLTQFQGDSDNLHFTSLSYTRSKKNVKLCRQSEVGYFLKNCRGRLDKSFSSQCLWRRINPIIDNRVEEGGRESVLLENISEFKLRYLGPEKEQGAEWIDKWKTGEDADDVTRGKFPSAVEITIELEKKEEEKKKQKLVSVAAIRFPNNQIFRSKKSKPTPQRR